MILLMRSFKDPMLEKADVVRLVFPVLKGDQSTFQTEVEQYMRRLPTERPGQVLLPKDPVEGCVAAAVLHSVYGGVPLMIVPPVGDAKIAWFDCSGVFNAGRSHADRFQSANIAFERVLLLNCSDPWFYDRGTFNDPLKAAVGDVLYRAGTTSSSERLAAVDLRPSDIDDIVQRQDDLLERIIVSDSGRWALKSGQVVLSPARPAWWAVGLFVYLFGFTNSVRWPSLFWVGDGQAGVFDPNLLRVPQSVRR